jgi:molybdenum cofactor cytidylyltransferase
MSTERDPIDCIVPAAGRSSRMGQWKPVLPFGASTIVETVVQAALAVCSRVILVGGYRGRELQEIFRDYPSVEFVENPDWSLGMFSSLRSAATRVQTPRFFITPGDMPWITPSHYTALLEALDTEVVIPTFEGQKGHPVLLRRAVAVAMVRAETSATTMREILTRFPVTLVPCSDAAILHDVDTPQEYQSPETPRT